MWQTDFKIALGVTFWLLTLCMSCVSRRAERISDCRNSDWYEIGREDGSLGRTVEVFQQHRKECVGQDQDTASVEPLYLNGREKGLIEFCTPNNGFNLGKSGDLYYYVCPYHLETQFLDEFRRGQKVLALQRENLRLDQRMSALLNAIRTPASSDQAESASKELHNLKQLRTRNDQELSKLNPVR